MNRNEFQLICRLAKQGNPRARAFLMGAQEQAAGGCPQPPQGSRLAVVEQPSRTVDPVVTQSELQQRLNQTGNELRQEVAQTRDYVQRREGRVIGGAYAPRELSGAVGHSGAAGKGGPIVSEIATITAANGINQGDTLQFQFPENGVLEGEALCSWRWFGPTDPSDQALFTISWTAGQNREIIGGQAQISGVNGASTIFYKDRMPFRDPSTGDFPILGTAVKLTATLTALADYEPDEDEKFYFLVEGGASCVGFSGEY